MSFPISTVNQRDFADDWAGEVFTCDIDRTYLMTRFSSMKGMARIPFEFAVDKTAVAGMTQILKEIRRGPERRSRQTPLYFVSASPSQLRPVIERKMLLDGLEFDGTTFKDWFGVVRTWRFDRFKEQIGFKLTALLARRSELPPGEVREVLIGDDLERDATAFSLYADLLAGRLAVADLATTLVGFGVAEDDAAAIVELKRLVGDRAEGVKRIYIRLERQQAEDFLPYAPHLVACSGSLQMALALWVDGSISLEGATRVANELVNRRDGEKWRQAIRQELLDSCRRGLISADQGAEALEVLARAGIVDADLTLPGVDPRWASQLERDDPCWTPATDR